MDSPPPYMGQTIPFFSRACGLQKNSRMNTWKSSKDTTVIHCHSAKKARLIFLDTHESGSRMNEFSGWTLLGHPNVNGGNPCVSSYDCFRIWEIEVLRQTVPPYTRDFRTWGTFVSFSISLRLEYGMCFFCGPKRNHFLFPNAQIAGLFCVISNIGGESISFFWSLSLRAGNEVAF